MLYGITDKPPWITALFLGIQHVLLVFSGTVMMPVMIARATGLNSEQTQYVVFATIIVSAVSTFLQIRRVGRVGSGYMLFMGSSGAFMAACLSAANMGGFKLVATMTILSAPLEIACSYGIRHLRKIITPAAGGTVIMLLALSIVPMAAGLWHGDASGPDYCSATRLWLGLITIACTIGPAIFGPPHVRQWSPVCGIACGTVACWLLGGLETGALKQEPFFGLPSWQWPGIEWRLTFAHLPVLLAFLFSTLASTIESIGDSMAVQKVSTPSFRKVDYASVQGCLYSDALGNMLAGALGTVPNTTYSGNIAVIELTGVASRRVGYCAAAVMALLAFLPKLTHLLVYLPGPVLASSTLVLVAMLMSCGLKLIASDEFSYETGIMSGCALVVGTVSTFGLFFPQLVADSAKPFVNNGVATGGLTALIINFAFRLKPHRAVTLRLNHDLSRLPDLTAAIEGLRERFSLDERQLFALKLTCEEVFAFLCAAETTQKEQDVVVFRWTRQEGGVVRVDIEDRSQVADIDGVELGPEPGKLTPDDLARLGLVLLNKLAADVSHHRISGYNCIGFEVGETHKE